MHRQFLLRVAAVSLLALLILILIPERARAAAIMSAAAAVVTARVIHLRAALLNDLAAVRGERIIWGTTDELQRARGA